MAYSCSACGGTYTTAAGCPNCKQIAAIERQTKAQAKFQKAQMKAMSGGGESGGGFAAALVNALAAMFTLPIKLVFGGLKAGVKAAHDHNPDAFWRFVKWAAAIFFGSALAMAVLQNLVKIFRG